jgi:hypothetical protein
VPWAEKILTSTYASGVGLEADVKSDLHPGGLCHLLKGSCRSECVRLPSAANAFDAAHHCSFAEQRE